MKVLESDDFKTVLVGIFEKVVVGKPRAFGAPMIQRVVASGLAAVFVGEISLSAECLNRLIEQSARLVGALGVIEVDSRGRCMRQFFARRRFASGLGVGERREQQEKGESLHYYYFRSSGGDFSCMGNAVLKYRALPPREVE